MNKLFLNFKKPGIAFCAGVAAIVCIIVSFYLFRVQVDSYIGQDMRAQVEEIQKSSSLVVQTEMNHFMRLSASAAQLLSHIELESDAEILQTLRNYGESAHVVRALFVTLDGHTYADDAGYLGQRPADALPDGAALAQITEPVFSQPVFNENLDEVLFSVLAPTTMAGKQGVLVSSYNIRTFSDMLADKAAHMLPEIGIINKQGEVVSGRSITEFKFQIFTPLRQVEFEESSVDAMQADFQNGASGFAIYRTGGTARYCSYAPIGLNDWYVIVMVREDTLRSKLTYLEKYGLQLTIELVLIMLGLLAVITATRLREQKKIRKVLVRAAMLDGLTGIYNRKAIEDTIEQRLCSAEDAARAALLVIDVDNFKQINDCRGHLFGDRVLKECANRLVSIFKHDGIVGRIGGDEFVVFLDDCESLAQIEAKIHGLIHHFYVLTDTGEKQKVSVSVGMAHAHPKANTFLLLYQLADNALYRAKQTGKERLST